MARADIKVKGSLFRPPNPIVIAVVPIVVAEIVSLSDGAGPLRWTSAVGTTLGSLCILWSFSRTQGLRVDHESPIGNAESMSWADVGLIWIEWSGPSWLPQRMRCPLWWVYSAEQVRYTLRTGFPPQRLQRRALGVDLTPEQVADLLRAFAPTRWRSAAVTVGSASSGRCGVRLGARCK